ncbi:hypothetical protein K8O68_10410 [Salipaludibacillus sp. CUR1]|uniref:hypothetical protein n=1 Tax=Salipaludibacillus sp. CUR1 TaxID=2820003 RepID=UPI001E4E5744|nr:hypothetical protein [Salipaludibacillus sp. CUR1]MCE7792827.1 hypothetical protein [Salipaludibacillus sp. CUR1]
MWMVLGLCGLVTVGCSSDDTEETLKLEGDYLRGDPNSTLNAFTLFVDDSLSGGFSFELYDAINELETYSAETYQVLTDEKTKIYLPNEKNPITADEFFNERGGREQFPQEVEVTFENAFEREGQEYTDISEVFSLNSQHLAKEVHFKPMTIDYINDVFKPINEEYVNLHTIGTDGGPSSDLMGEIKLLDNFEEINTDGRLNYDFLNEVNRFFSHQQPDELDFDITETRGYLISIGQDDKLVTLNPDEVLEWVKETYDFGD